MYFIIYINIYNIYIIAKSTLHFDVKHNLCSRFRGLKTDSPIQQWFSKCGSQTVGVSITWGLLETVLKPIADPMNQEPGWS